MSLVPKQILNDRYLILASLDQGSLSQTYVALDQQQQVDVIVKELHLHQLDNWKTHELFERESRVLQNIQHAGIPRWLDFFGDDLGGRLFLVIEKINGQTWLEKIEKGWRPSQTELTDLIAQSLDILEYLHQLSPPVIHRDLKPSNLMVDSAGQVYLIDFGVAQDLLHPEGGRTVVGTFGYMAPEQFSGQAVPASDLYALGMSLIHLLSGRRPSEMQQSGQRVLFEEYLQVSPALKTWLQNLTAPQLALRYRSAAEARESLKQLSSGKTATLQPTQLPQRIRPGIHKTLLLAGIGLVAMLGIGASLSFFLVSSSNSSSPSITYQGPCISGDYRLPNVDNRPEAQAFRQDFESRFPQPGWWEQVEAPAFGAVMPLNQYAACKQRSNDQVLFKAAYLSLVSHPLEDSLVITAINHMANAEPDYPELTPLLEFGLESYFYDQQPRAATQPGAGAADRIAWLAQKLAKRYHQQGLDASTVALLQRFLKERAQELNPQMQQLLIFEYAQALWKTGQSALAVQSLNQGIALAGDWDQKLMDLKSQIEKG